MKIFSSLLMLVLYTVFFFAVPIYHTMTNRDLQPALKINVDSLSTIVGLLGVSVITAVVSLHRRIASLEKAASTGTPGNKS
jgi:uncharacterized membrane protein YdcZ (DUF606 family)